eukprot:gene32380-41045_t
MAHSYRLLRRNMLDTRYEMEEKALTKEEEIIMKVHLVSPLEKSLQRVAYVLLFGMWIIIAWSLFTYSVLIREIMGPETEADVVMQWAITLAVEVFGAQTLQLIALRVCVDAAMMKLERRFYSMMLIICILSPVTMILSQLYMIAAGTKVPGHWCYRRTRKVEAVFGPKLLAFAQTAAVAAYAIFFNMRKFNKFLAV